jgi:hypothetical protein
VRAFTIDVTLTPEAAQPAVSCQTNCIPPPQLCVTSCAPSSRATVEADPAPAGAEEISPLSS